MKDSEAAFLATIVPSRAVPKRGTEERRCKAHTKKALPCPGYRVIRPDGTLAPTCRVHGSAPVSPEGMRAKGRGSIRAGLAMIRRVEARSPTASSTKPHCIICGGRAEATCVGGMTYCVRCLAMLASVGMAEPRVYACYVCAKPTTNTVLYCNSEYGPVCSDACYEKIPEY